MPQPTVQDRIAALKAQTATTLQTTEGNLLSRLAGLGLGPVCGRCGGSGNYSFNQMDGTRCYGCQGKRVLPPKKLADWQDALAQAEAAAASGRLDAYLAYLRAQKTAKNATQIVMEAWRNTGISDLYDWRKACERDEQGRHRYPDDRRLSNANKLMSDEYKRVETLTHELTAGNQTQEERQAATVRVAEAVQTAVARIRRAAEVHLAPEGADPRATALASLLDAHSLTSSCQSYGALLRRAARQPDSPLGQEYAALRRALEAAHVAAATGENLDPVLEDLLARTERSPASLLRQCELQEWKALLPPLNVPNERDLRERVAHLNEAVTQARAALDHDAVPGMGR